MTIGRTGVFGDLGRGLLTRSVFCNPRDPLGAVVGRLTLFAEGGLTPPPLCKKACFTLPPVAVAGFIALLGLSGITDLVRFIFDDAVGSI